jgi:hypothetical protein
MIVGIISESLLVGVQKLFKSGELCNILEPCTTNGNMLVYKCVYKYGCLVNIVHFMVLVNNV